MPVHILKHFPGVKSATVEIYTTKDTLTKGTFVKTCDTLTFWLSHPSLKGRSEEEILQFLFVMVNMQILTCKWLICNIIYVTHWFTSLYMNGNGIM